jgi:hypothetical protein
MVLVAGMAWAPSMQGRRERTYPKVRTRPRTQQRAAPGHHPRHSHYFAKGSYALATRRRAPSKRLEYQPAIVEMRTTVPVCGAWMKRP